MAPRTDDERIKTMGVNGFRRIGATSECMTRIVVGLVNHSTTYTVAKTLGAVMGAKFAMQFAAMCGFSTLAVA